MRAGASGRLRLDAISPESECVARGAASPPITIASVLPFYLAAILACTRIGAVSPEQMVKDADLIVRAKVIRTSISSDSGKIVFRVEQVVKGKGAPAELELAGSVSAGDDFNDQPVPYRFVRPDGRAGTCFADTYRKGAEYLLFLKALKRGGYTTNWEPLGPTNEQLRGSDDPWLKWVTARAAGGAIQARTKP
jgi:hypothetical protein